MDCRVVSTHAEDIASGAAFGPGEIAVGVDPSDPYDRTKIEEGKLLPLDPPAEPKATEAAVKKAAELGVDLSTVTATGANDQITVDDVANAVPTPSDSEEASP